MNSKSLRDQLIEIMDDHNSAYPNQHNKHLVDSFIMPLLDKNISARLARPKQIPVAEAIKSWLYQFQNCATAIELDAGTISKRRLLNIFSHLHGQVTEIQSDIERIEPPKITIPKG